MKTYRRVLATFLAILMLPLLSGCSVFETRLAQAIEKMSRKNNLHYELALTLELELAAGEETEDGAERFLRLPGSFEAEGTLYTEPFQLQADAQLILPGARTRWECYLEKDETAYYFYSRMNDGVLWQKQGLADDGKSQVKGLRYIVKGSESFLPAGEEMLRGQFTERYDGVIPGEYLSGLLQLYGVHEWLCDELGMELEDGLFDELPDVPASVWLDKESRMIVQADADLGELLAQIAERQLAESRRVSSFDTLGLTADLKRAHLSLHLSDYDAAEPFAVPEDAMSAWGSGVMPWDK